MTSKLEFKLSIEKFLSCWNYFWFSFYSILFTYFFLIDWPFVLIFYKVYAWSLNYWESYSFFLLFVLLSLKRMRYLTQMIIVRSQKFMVKRRSIRQFQWHKAIVMIVKRVDVHALIIVVKVSVVVLLLLSWLPKARLHI